MKTIGLIGGISYASTLDYYRSLNELVHKELGKLHSSKVVLVSLDLEEYASLAHSGDFHSFKSLIRTAGAQVKRADADFLVICSNTAHMAVTPTIDESVVDDSIASMPPVLHIADCCAKEIKSLNMEKIGFLGTKFTMKEPFLLNRLRQHGLQVFAPTDDSELDAIQDVIERELSHNIINPESKHIFLNSIDKLVCDHGVQGIILGCTEIPLIIKQEDMTHALSHVKLFDSMTIHVSEAVKVQLGQTQISSYLSPSHTSHLDVTIDNSC